MQESASKDVERPLGVIQARLDIVRHLDLRWEKDQMLEVMLDWVIKDAKYDCRGWS
jgi:hypothetical protein